MLLLTLREYIGPQPQGSELCVNSREFLREDVGIHATQAWGGSDKLRGL
jgi:hypothetical protein